MKNLVLISDGNHYEFDSLEELKEFIVPNYSNIDKTKIENYLYEKVFGYSMLNDIQIVETSKGVYEGDYQIGDEIPNFDNAIIIDNLDTYILSLCKFNAIMLLEKKDNRIYTKNIDINLGEENYIVVNAYANELLSKIVGEIK